VLLLHGASLGSSAPNLTMSRISTFPELNGS
jgi:hypothetical protein